MKKRWADGPLPLIETPRHRLEQQGSAQSSSAAAATEMAHVHNIMIRGLNSMMIQAPFVSNPADVRDFVDYALSFCIVIHEHHNTEEALFFPLIEDATGIIGVMDNNVIQHQAFHPKIHEFNTYLNQIKLGVRQYDSKKYLQLLEGFSGLLVDHLAAEVEMLVGLEKYAIDWTPIKDRSQKHAIETAEKYQQIPFFLHNMDITFENNLHTDVWPPFPWIAHLIFRWFYVPKFKGAWRFGSCDAYGRPKELEFAPTT